ncbi:hypothetical protein OS493_032482 [Desmophyllum pertusum]|uniref:Uncharacterized protein n=1 Tax=Desmophyllum pertusum TaxID=174260 RepID=A0A9X0D0Z8_9CNID|nr:hypothetical protein OS493_032482 [Desmophyllum pertusum]
MKDCRQQSDPLCLLVIQYKDTSRKYRRFCASRNTYDQIKNNCKACVVGKCSTTGCKAEVTELPPPAPVGPFMCPFCNGRGENALSNCDKKISYDICNDAYADVVKDPVCAVFTRTEGSGLCRKVLFEQRRLQRKSSCLQI